jgi:hypothetical protein
VWRADNPRRWRERFAGAEIAAVLSNPDVSVVYIPSMNADAYGQLMADQNVQVVPLLSTTSGEPQLSNVAAIVRRER